MIKIYKLIHNGEIVYVGKTTYKLLSKRKSCGYAKNEQLHKISKECTIELIEETDDITRERYWIDLLRSENHPLLNIRGGSLENKEKRKEYQKEYREKNKEKKKEYDKKYSREYYNKNKEKMKVRKRQYMKEYNQKDEVKVRRRQYMKEYNEAYYEKSKNKNYKI